MPPLIHETYQMKQFFLQMKYKDLFSSKKGPFGIGPGN